MVSVQVKEGGVWRCAWSDDMSQEETPERAYGRICGEESGSGKKRPVRMIRETFEVISEFCPGSGEKA